MKQPDNWEIYKDAIVGILVILLSLAWWNEWYISRFMLIVACVIGGMLIWNSLLAALSKILALIVGWLRRR
jgi:hypothetical protein